MIQGNVVNTIYFINDTYIITTKADGDKKITISLIKDSVYMKSNLLALHVEKKYSDGTYRIISYDSPRLYLRVKNLSSLYMYLRYRAFEHSKSMSENHKRKLHVDLTPGDIYDTIV